MDLKSFTGGFKEEKSQIPAILYPQLACQVNIDRERIIFSQYGRNFSFQVEEKSKTALEKLLLMMDGTRSIQELQKNFSGAHLETLNTIISNLDDRGLINDAAKLNDNLRLERTLELENNNKAKSNCFKTKIDAAEEQVKKQFLSGFAIENYHFLSRKSYFYSALQGFQNWTQNDRKLIAQRCDRESKQEELLLKVLEAIDISESELAETMPLPQTMSICNALSYWANFEPFFCSSILKILDDRTGTNFEWYLGCCEGIFTNQNFLTPIRELVNIKLAEPNESFSNFQIDLATKQRFQGQIYLFLEIYDDFIEGIWNYYSEKSDLLRLVTVI